MRRFVGGLVVVAALFSGCGGGGSKASTFSVTSADVKDGLPLAAAQMSRKLGAGGSDTSPQLSWSGFPATTKSFAVTMFDRDAQFWHWAKANIPANVTSLAAGAPGYVGAAPPPGSGTHHYVITVYALDVAVVRVPATATPGKVASLFEGHALARASIVATARR